MANANNKLIDVKLTEKDLKTLATVNLFLKGFKDCKDKEQKDKYVLDNACSARMIQTLGKAVPEDVHLILSSALIQLVIPYLIAEDGEDVKEVADRLDKQTDEMMKALVEAQSKAEEQNKE